MSHGVNRADIIAIFQQMGGEAMTQGMGAAGFGNIRFDDSFPHRFL